MPFRSCCLALALAGSAGAQTSLFTVNSIDNLLREIDPATGATLSSVPITVVGFTVTQSQALATDPTTGFVYAVVSFTAAQARRLVLLDTHNGQGSAIGDLGDRFAGLAFDGAGQLYGVTGDGATVPESLYAIEKSDATKTLLTALGNGSMGETIGFQPATGLLYHASGQGALNNPTTGQILETIDPVSLAVTPVTLSGEMPTGTQCLVRFDANGFLACDQSGVLYQLGNDGVLTVKSTLDHFPKGLAYAPGPSFFEAYGTGCIGSGAATPSLAGGSTPNPGILVSFDISSGLGGALGVFVFGAGNGTFPVITGCSGGIAPLLPFSLPLTLNGAGAGGGTLDIPAQIPAAAPPFDLYAQVFFADPGAPRGISATNPLRMHVQ